MWALPTKKDHTSLRKAGTRICLQLRNEDFYEDPSNKESVMRFKTIAATSSLIIIAVIVFASVNKKTSVNTKNKPRTKRQSAYYHGVEEPAVYSKSDITLSEKIHKFSPVLQGDRVEHDFFLKNDTKEMIELIGMKSCCGFILTAQPKQIFPGEKGKISVLVFTDKYGGKTLTGKIRAKFLNEDDKEFSLALSLRVKKIASVSKHKIFLKGKGSGLIEGSATIIPEPDFPFEITGIKHKKGIHIDYHYDRVEENGVVKFIVSVKNRQKNKRVYRDVLFVQTDNLRRPELRIRVEGHISE